jgi:hypothetical protein
MRYLLCAAVCLTAGVAVSMAAKGQMEKATEHQAVFVKADTAHNTVTFMTKDRAGKEVELTLPLAANAKVLGGNNKTESLEALAKNKIKEKDKGILIIEDKEAKHIVEIKDLPTK